MLAKEKNPQCTHVAASDDEKALNHALSRGPGGERGTRAEENVHVGTAPAPPSKAGFLPLRTGTALQLHFRGQLGDDSPEGADPHPLLLALHIPHTTKLLPGGQAGGKRRRHWRPVYGRVPVEEAVWAELLLGLSGRRAEAGDGETNTSDPEDPVQASSDSLERRGWKVRSISFPHRDVEALQEFTELQEETRGKICQGATGRKCSAGGEDML